MQIIKNLKTKKKNKVTLLLINTIIWIIIVMIQPM